MLLFIEEYFGVAPDGGNGSIELFIFVLLIVLLVLFVFRLLITKNPPK
jgi:hypothetical protein